VFVPRRNGRMKSDALTELNSLHTAVIHIVMICKEEEKSGRESQCDPKDPLLHFYTANLTRLFEKVSSNLSRLMNLSRSPAASNRSS